MRSVHGFLAHKPLLPPIVSNKLSLRFQEPYIQVLGFEETHLQQLAFNYSILKGFVLSTRVRVPHRNQKLFRYTTLHHHSVFLLWYESGALASPDLLSIVHDRDHRQLH
jgi:hypothetical protein